MVYRTFVLVFTVVFLAGLPSSCKGKPDQSRGRMTGIIIAPPECAGQQVTVKLVKEGGVPEGATDAGEQIVTLSNTGFGSYHLAPTPQPKADGIYRAVVETPVSCGATTADSPSAPYRLYKEDLDMVQHNFAFAMP